MYVLVRAKSACTHIRVCLCVVCVYIRVHVHACGVHVCEYICTRFCIPALNRDRLCVRALVRVWDVCKRML
jgi:hypothetical protein